MKFVKVAFHRVKRFKIDPNRYKMEELVARGFPKLTSLFFHVRRYIRGTYYNNMIFGPLY